MEAVAYDSSSADKLEFKPANVQPILQVSTKKFPDAFSQCKISANRRFLALNSKNPGFVKVFQRITARHIDLGELITGEVVAIQFLAESDKFIVTSTEKEVVVVTMTENGDQSLSAAEQKFTLSAVAKKIAVYSEGNTEKGALVLAEDGAIYDISVSGSDAPKQVYTAVKTDTPFLASGAGVVAAPGKDGAVQVLDISGGYTDVLSKPWFPHGGEAVTDAIVLTKGFGRFGVVTGAENNSELRFWTIKNQSATLHQTITLSGADKDAKRQLLIDPNGLYIAVLSSGDASAVMLEIDMAKISEFSIRRVTEWAGTSPFVCGTLFIRKVTTGNKLSQDLTLVARNNERLALLTFDTARLEGAPNLGDVQEKKEKTTGGDDANILKWFGKGGNADDDKTGNVSIQSSNAKDGGKAKEEAKSNAAVQAELAKITASVQALLAQVKDGVESLQPMAGENLTLLQSGGFQDLADALGKAKALELNLPVGGGGRGAVRDEKLRRLYTAIADQATAQMNNVASVSFEKTLKKNADRVGPKLASGSVTAKDIAIPKLGGTDSMRNFTLRMDKAHSTQNDVMRKQVESVRAQCDEIVAAAKKRSTAAMMTTKHHLKSVQTELAELKAEVATLSTMQPRVAGTVTSSTSGSSADKLAKCRALALGGNWEQAFAQLLEAANLSLLLQFLELDEVVENRVKITSSGCLSFPIILSLCQQLTHNITSQAGVIPLRIGWLHDVLVGWDDEFTVLKGGNAADSELFFKCSGDFENMAALVSSINRGDVDAATRRQLMFVKKLLTNLA